jgi:hypothetical protein
MTEPKRAAWREFVEWVADERAVYSPGPTHGLRAATGYVSSEREAVAALMGCGVRTVFIDGLVDEWRDVLEGQGIYPPVDPPSVAEVLESVADELDSWARKFDDAARKHADNEMLSAVEFAWGEAHTSAAMVVRAKAKEFA